MYKEQAISDLKMVEKLTVIAVKNPAKTMQAIQIWSSNQSQSQLNANSLVTFGLSLARLPVGLMSVSGHVFSTSREVNIIFDNIK